MEKKLSKVLAVIAFAVIVGVAGCSSKKSTTTLAAPKVVSASVSAALPGTINVLFDQPILTGTTAGTGFTVAGSDAVIYSIAADAATAAQLDIALSQGVSASQTITLSFDGTPNVVTDAGGSMSVAAFTAVPVDTSAVTVSLTLKLTNVPALIAGEDYNVVNVVDSAGTWSQRVLANGTLTTGTNTYVFPAYYVNGLGTDPTAGYTGWGIDPTLAGANLTFQIVSPQPDPTINGSWGTSCIIGTLSLNSNAFFAFVESATLSLPLLDVSQTITIDCSVYNGAIGVPAPQWQNYEGDTTNGHDATNTFIVPLSALSVTIDSTGASVTQ